MCRPEGDGSREQTLRREILKQACAVVGDPRLLGFCRAMCLTGPEQGRVLVRSVFRAEVQLLPWEPRFETAHRQVVPVAELLSHLWMEENGRGIRADLPSGARRSGFDIEMRLAGWGVRPCSGCLKPHSQQFTDYISLIFKYLPDRTPVFLAPSWYN
jgi:hypothetical protein